MSAAEDATPQPDSRSDLATEEQQDVHTKNEPQAQANNAAGQAGSSKPEASRSGVCGVCNENPGKYKCPRCRMP